MLKRFFAPCSNTKINYTYLLSFILIVGYVLLKNNNRWFADSFLAILAIWATKLNSRSIMNEKIMYLLIAAPIIEILAWLHGMYFSPYKPGVYTTAPMLNLFYFVVIAYWLQANIKRVLLLLNVYSLGVIWTCVHHSPHPIVEFMVGLSGSRVDFHVVNANHPAALAGAAVIAQLFVLYILFKNKNILLKWQQYVYVSSSAILLLINFLIVYMTQSRAVWLALSAVLCLTAIFAICQRQSVMKKVFFIFGVIVICLVIVKLPAINARIYAEHNVMQELTKESTYSNIDSVADTSVGLRVKFWYSAIPWIKQYPILGLGDENARVFVIQNSPYLDKDTKNNYGHLHNGHVDVLVGYGFLGLALIWAIYAYLLKKCIQSDHEKYKPYLIYGLLAYTLYFFVINGFESFFTYKAGELMQSVFLACVFTFLIKDNACHVLPKDKTPQT